MPPPTRAQIRATSSSLTCSWAAWPHHVSTSVEPSTAALRPCSGWSSVAVRTADDLPELADPPPELRAAGPRHRGRPILARGRVRYTGEPVAVVAADDPYLAADAAEAVVLDIEPLPGAGDVLAATAPGAP